VSVCRVDGQSHARQVGLEIGDELIKVDSISVAHLPVDSVAAIIRFALDECFISLTCLTDTIRYHTIQRV